MPFYVVSFLFLHAERVIGGRPAHLRHRRRATYPVIMWPQLIQCSAKSKNLFILFTLGRSHARETLLFKIFFAWLVTLAEIKISVICYWFELKCLDLTFAMLWFVLKWSFVLALNHQLTCFECSYFNFFNSEIDFCFIWLYWFSNEIQILHWFQALFLVLKHF